MPGLVEKLDPGPQPVLGLRESSPQLVFIFELLLKLVHDGAKLLGSSFSLLGFPL